MDVGRGLPDRYLFDHDDGAAVLTAGPVVGMLVSDLSSATFIFRQDPLPGGHLVQRATTIIGSF